MTKNEKEALKKGFIRQWRHASALMRDAEKHPGIRADAQACKWRAIGAKYLTCDILLADHDDIEAYTTVKKWIQEAEDKAGYHLIRL